MNHKALICRAIHARLVMTFMYESHDVSVRRRCSAVRRG